MRSLPPAYALYGEDAAGFPDELHIETIRVRSRVHDWNIRLHRHGELYQFFLLTHGGGMATIDGARHPLQAGTAIAMPPLVVHGFAFEPDTDGFVASVPPAVLDRATFGDGAWRRDLARPVRIEPRPAEVAHLAQVFGLALQEFAEGRAGRREALTAVSGLILVAFRRAIAAALPDAAGARAAPGQRLFERFKAEVEAHYRAHLPIADFARRLGTSPQHLTRTCRALSGRSALEIAHDRIVLEARRHLLYTSMTVAEVAFLLGFSDPAYFTRFFGQRTGVSPSAYRQAVEGPGRPPAERVAEPPAGEAGALNGRSG